MDTDSPSTEVKIIKPTYALQKRVGTGEVDSLLVYKAQMTIDTNKVDFKIVAMPFLEQLEKNLKKIKETTFTFEDVRNLLIRPVVELKATGRMFKYDLVTSLTNVMVTFLDSVSTLDDDVISIVAAHYDTLCMILDRKMDRDGGPHGRLLLKELIDACNRYMTSRSLPDLKF